MGLIRAAVAGAASALGDTWKEFFYCDSLPPDVLVVKGKKRTSRLSSNRGDDNIITSGSVLVVNEGQCMIIVDQGSVVEICAIPGEYKYDASTEPSLFCGSLGAGIKATFKNIGKRISFGGDAAHDQRIYYFNIKEITDNKFGTSTPIPFRVSYQDIGRPFTVGLRCNGVYSYKIVDPILFYQNVCGNVSGNYSRSQLDETLYSEFMSKLQPAFAKLTSTVRYDELPTHTDEITKAMKEVLQSDWKETRGIEIFRVSIKSVSIPKEDEDKIKQYEDIAWNRNPLNAAASTLGAQNQAMNTAAGNRNGAVAGFYGMNMAQSMGGAGVQNLYSMGMQQQQSQGASWLCSCGTSNTAKFCANCGKPNPTENGWKCSCGATNSGKFCAECGKPKPAGGGQWKCSCGATNSGKFCAECGKPKPSDNGEWKCSCGATNSGRFCANCGKPKS